MPNNTKNIENTTEANQPPSSKEVQRKTHTFYQVLIDQRDCPYIRAQTEAVTFLGNQESSRSLYAIPGLDYVAHEDVLPYSASERTPLQHELFDKFLAFNAEKETFEAQDVSNVIFSNTDIIIFFINRHLKLGNRRIIHGSNYLTFIRKQLREFV